LVRQEHFLWSASKEIGPAGSSYGRVVDELELLYRRKLTKFCRTAAAIAGDAELGRDAVQDAFALALRKRRRFRGEGSLEAWVWRIVINAALDARRRKPRVLDAPAERSAVPSGEGLPFDVLTPRQREVLFLHYYADLDYAAIGKALNISPGTVGATLSAARERLRPALLREATG
jgi:DNA-directed RNA polymerase specialized sigma24 family protein